MGLIGAGGYAQKFCCQTQSCRRRVLLDSFRVRSVGPRRGDEIWLRTVSSDAQSVIDDEEANLIVIATRHGSHAALAQLALEHGKHVFVENRWPSTTLSWTL